MKTTIELPDAVLREAKAAAALRGESLREFFEEALRGHLAAVRVPKGEEPWRKFVGTVPKEATDEVDAIIADEIRQIEYESWR
jgi:hypothetical protein